MGGGEIWAGREWAESGRTGGSCGRRFKVQSADLPESRYLPLWRVKLFSSGLTHAHALAPRSWIPIADGMELTGWEQNVVTTAVSFRLWVMFPITFVNFFKVYFIGRGGLYNAMSSIYYNIIHGTITILALKKGSIAYK